jgi:hypothetical protein
MHFLEKTKKNMFFLVLGFFFLQRASQVMLLLDVLRQNQKTAKTIGLNQWFFHANPDLN